MNTGRTGQARKETNDLEERADEFAKPAEKRNEHFENIKKGAGVVVRGFNVPEGQPAAPENVRDSAEYRSAFMKRLMGLPLNDVEQRDMTTAANSVGVVVPTATQNEIIKKIKETAPLMDEITLLHVAGNVTFAVEGTVADVTSVHSEGGAITASDDTLVSIHLAGYEIVNADPHFRNRPNHERNAFEAWLVEMLSEKIALAIEYFIVKGTGSNQPEGH